MGLKVYVEKAKTVTYTFVGGAVVGSLYYGFGHLRQLYSEDYRLRRREMDLLKHEDKDKLSARLVIGAMTGAIAGTVVGLLLAKGHDDDQPEEE